jgi:hypothetical protein
LEENLCPKERFVTCVTRILSMAALEDLKKREREREREREMGKENLSLV